MKKKLITVALPYVNNIPHLGNLIQVLSGDVFARYCRNRGYETLYICGTDEYGTATETRALKEKISPKTLCDYFHEEHKAIYSWFNIKFDYFGRTSNLIHTEIVQEIFKKIENRSLIFEKNIEQLFCTTCDRFLADRLVHGTCPHCDYKDARGDQCDGCGKLLDATELIAPRCEICGGEPEIRQTNHLYLDLPKLKNELEIWINQASSDGFWANNALAMTKSWIRDGLRERCITRDLKWGIPVPKKGYENKVFYVWFDAPIGYISMTADLLGDYYKEWWQNPSNVELFQFIGKDNIPFHTVIFPSTLIATHDPWTMLHHISSTEYLNYEGNKFSKSRGIGVFGNDCQSTGIDADIWRFYLYYNRPEKSDSQFIWKDFFERVNSELIGNLGNFINRTLAFTSKFYEGKVPTGLEDKELWAKVRILEAELFRHMECCEIREALKTLLAISDLGNKYFQTGEPWRLRVTESIKAEGLIYNLLYLVRDIAMLLEIFMPVTSEKLLAMLNSKMDWRTLAGFEGLNNLNEPTILFKMLDPLDIDRFRLKYSGSQEERDMAEENKEPLTNQEGSFTGTIDLRVAQIIRVLRHPDGDKLYILHLNLGSEERQIVSSIVPFYKEEELLNKKIILVANLKKSKFRGELSEGMLLAAEAEGSDDDCEVIFTDAEIGSRFSPLNEEIIDAKRNISIDRFRSFPIKSIKGVVCFANLPLVSATKKLYVTKFTDNDIG